MFVICLMGKDKVFQANEAAIGIFCQQKQSGIWGLQVLMCLVQNGGFDW